jgi:hypothetical protein
MRSTIEAGGASLDNARRSGPVAVIFIRRSAHSARASRPWSCSCGAGLGRYGGNCLRPGAGGAVRGSSPRRRAPARRARRKAAAPATAIPRRPFPLITGPRPLYPPPVARASLCSRFRPPGVARRRCALEAVEKGIPGLAATQDRPFSSLFVFR